MIPVHGYTPPDIRHPGWHHPPHRAVLFVRNRSFISRAQSDRNPYAGGRDGDSVAIGDRDRRDNSPTPVYRLPDAARNANATIDGYRFRNADTDGHTDNHRHTHGNPDRDTHRYADGHAHRDSDCDAHGNPDRNPDGHADGDGDADRHGDGNTGGRTDGHARYYPVSLIAIEDYYCGNI